MAMRACAPARCRAQMRTSTFISRSFRSLLIQRQTFRREKSDDMQGTGFQNKRAEIVTTCAPSGKARRKPFKVF
jgi:hypothetical protein